MILSLWAQSLALGLAALGLVALWARKLISRIKENDLAGEVVVITGAGSGIGRLTAFELVKCGCKLALWDLNGASLKAVLMEIEKTGGEARMYVVDVTNRQQVYDSGRQVLSDFGQVNILINNAGIVSGKKILENDDDMMEKTVQVNTISHFWTIKAFLPGMLERNHGKIVTIASIAGIAGSAGLVDYCASKYGAVGLAETLAMELLHQKKTGVKSICICPFYVKTGMFEGIRSSNQWLLPLLEPEYVAQKIVSAIKRDTSMLMMPRFCYMVPLLKSVLPTSLAICVMDYFKINESMTTFQQTRVNNFSVSFDASLKNLQNGDSTAK